MIPVVYFLVIFSIVVHGLSIPALDAFYRYKGVAPIVESEPVEIRVLSDNDALPNNAYTNAKRNSVIVHNRFSRPVSIGPDPELYRWNPRDSHGSAQTPVEEVDYEKKLQYIRMYGGMVEEKGRSERQ